MACVIAAIGRDIIRSSGGGGNGPGCAANNRSSCNNECFCRWKDKDDQCAPWNCQNNTQEQPCSKETCNDGVMCEWTPAMAAAAELPMQHAAPAGSCVPAICNERKTKANCSDTFSCEWQSGKCILGGGHQQTEVQVWRSALDDALHGHWYSSQSVSEAVPGTTGQPTWRIAKVEAVKNKSCVDDAMVGEVLTQNASCFTKCGPAVKKTSDCYIRCLFGSLLGNQSTGQAPLGGSLNVTGHRLHAAFTSAFAAESAGGCPELIHGKQQPDAWVSEHDIVGVKELTLYSLTHANGSMTNANSADAPGAASLLLGTSGVAGSVHVSERITQVHVEVNALFGEFTLCSNASAGGVVKCAPTWDCLCECQPGDGGCKSHCETEDPSQPCECVAWGGCKNDTHNNAGVQTVGWRSLSPKGNVYSTMAGGECGTSSRATGVNAIACTWLKVSEGKTVETRCVEARLRAGGTDEEEDLVGAWEAGFAACPGV